MTPLTPSRRAATFSLLVLATGCGSRSVVEDEALRNATYLTDMTDDGFALLTDGEFTAPGPEGSAGQTIIVYDRAVQGDLDGDGIDDAAVILIEQGGGTGTFYQLHAVVSEDSVARDRARRMLGDRIIIRGIAIDSGLVHVQMLVRGSGVPQAGTPDTPLDAWFALTDRGLRVVESGPQETDAAVGLTARAVGGDLIGPVWKLAAIEGLDDLPELASRPSIAFFPELTDQGGISGRFSGTAGCNRIFGTFRAEAGGSLTVGSIASTMMACGESAMEVERDLLERLPAAMSYEVEGTALMIKTAVGLVSFSAE